MAKETPIEKTFKHTVTKDCKTLDEAFAVLRRVRNINGVKVTHSKVEYLPWSIKDLFKRRAYRVIIDIELSIVLTATHVQR